jgi:uncharacterized RDD family membrane protein YckC
MTIPYQAPTRPLFGTSAEDYIDAVLGCVPAAADRQRIDAELRARLDPAVTVERAIAIYGRPRDLAEFYLAAKPLESAPFVRRAIAALIDIPSVIATGFAIFYFGWQLFGSGGSFITAILTGNILAIGMGFAALFLMSPLYYITAETTLSQTVGKAIMGIRTVRESGARITIGQAFVRQIPLFFSFMYALDAGFALFTKKKQRLFELISKTRVVKV